MDPLGLVWNKATVPRGAKIVKHPNGSSAAPSAVVPSAANGSSAAQGEAAPSMNPRLSYVREAQSLTADEDARIARALGGQLDPEDFSVVFLKALEFKRRLLALRVIQRHSREVLRRSSRTPDRRSGKSAGDSWLPEREAAIIAGMRLLGERLSFAGLEQETMGDDGNCQFRALAHQLFGSQVRT